MYRNVDNYKFWMLILVFLCENERLFAQRFYVYRDASHLSRSFSHNSTKINIQFLNTTTLLSIGYEKERNTK